MNRVAQNLRPSILVEGVIYVVAAVAAVFILALMGVIVFQPDVLPDSFSGLGFKETRDALSHGREVLAQRSDLLGYMVGGLLTLMAAVVAWIALTFARDYRAQNAQA